MSEFEPKAQQVWNDVEVHDDVEHNDLRSRQSSRGLSDRQPQILDRHINLSSVINFGLITIVSWEAFAVTFQFALANGGPASMLYGCLFVGSGGTAVAFSLAELASIDPTVGAQYRWSASLAPFAPRFFGLLQGWLTIFAWICGCAAGPSLLANIILGIAKFNNMEYEIKAWHTTLLMCAMIVLPVFFNLWFRRVLATFETIGGVCHFVFFIISVITLATLAKRSPTDWVFTELTSDVSGWNNAGVSWGLGLLTITFAVNGFDGVLHMSDEVKKVKSRVPRSIIYAVVINSTMLLAFVICLLFTVGNVNKVANTPTHLPLIVVYYQATESKTFASILTAFPAIVFFFTIFNIFASVSRLIWVFAKDHGLPFSRTFAYVHASSKLPLNALALTCIISMLISLIYLGSSTAFNAIISLQAMALSVSYLPPVTFHGIRRILGTAPAPGPHTMGKKGLLVNIYAFIYLVFVIIWMPFPQFLPVDSTNMNYAGPLLGAVILIAISDWFISGRKRFQVPVKPDI